MASPQRNTAPPTTAAEPALPVRDRPLRPISRVLLAGSGSFVVGGGLGAFHGAKMAGLRFRAEHAHNLPSETTGWYLYHKTKNYNATVGGLREGIRMGFKTCFWTSAMLGIEGMFDESRGTADIFNTVLAGLSVACGFSVWNRFTIPEAGRTARMALFVSIAWGGLQDVSGILRGRRIGYVEFVKRQLGELGSRRGSNASPA